MNKEKSALRAAAIHELGLKFEDRREAIMISASAHGLAADGITAVAKQMGEIYGIVDDDLDKGFIPQEPLAVAEYIKKLVGRIAAKLASGVEYHKEERLKASGRLQEIDGALKLAKTFHDIEMSAMRALEGDMAETERRKKDIESRKAKKEAPSDV